MSASFHDRDAARLSAAHLRAETAAVLRPVYERAVKMVAAVRNCSRSRVDRELEEHDPNRLEMLARDLDRIAVEKGAAAVRPVVAWLSERYQTGRPEGDGITAAFLRCVREGKDAECALIEAAPNGLDDLERRRVLVELHEYRDAVNALLTAVEAKKS